VVSRALTAATWSLVMAMEVHVLMPSLGACQLQLHLALLQNPAELQHTKKTACLVAITGKEEQRRWRNV